MKDKKLNITIFGTGYVGLVSGACFAEIGHNVTCCDTDQNKIKKLKNSNIPIYEEGLEKIVIDNQQNGNLSFCTLDDLELAECELAIIAVGTPNNKNGQTNLSYVESVVDFLKMNLGRDAVVMVKSTVPLGTCEKIYKSLNEDLAQEKIDVISNPEFLREGSAVKDFLEPERIVLGYRESSTKNILEKLYAPLSAKTEIIHTDCSTSELIKYASNAFLAAKVAFINEMASICEKIGADINVVSTGMGMDSRIGSKFLNPGPGFGGSCFPKDVQALSSLTKKMGANNDLISSIEKSNIKWKESVADRVSMIMKESGCNKIAIWGVTYKANTDDIRSSAVIDIIENLLESDYEILCYDPQGLDRMKMVFGGRIRYSKNKYDIASEADMVLVATEWEEFRGTNFTSIDNPNGKIFFDLRNIINKVEAKKHGISLYNLGYKDIYG